MKILTIFFLCLPLILHSQDNNIPYVKIENGSILFYIPSQSIDIPLFPVEKPGFVHIIKTPGIQTQTNRHVSDNLVSGIRHLLSGSMTQAQKTEFLENYACLVLLNYTRIAELDTRFYNKAISLKGDPNPEIKENASILVRMVKLYLEN